MLDSYDLSIPHSFSYQNRTFIIVGRWLNGMASPMAVRIFALPPSGKGSLLFIEEYTEEWSDWGEAIKKTESRIQLLVDYIS